MKTQDEKIFENLKKLISHDEAIFMLQQIAESLLEYGRTDDFDHYDQSEIFQIFNRKNILQEETIIEFNKEVLK